MSHPDAARDAEYDALTRRLAPLDLVPVTVDVAGAAVPLIKPRSAEALISAEDFEVDERLPYWADVWPSARALAGTVRGLAGAGGTLLELGCGCGLVAMEALAAGFRVTATDYYDDALAVTRLNALERGTEAAARLAVRHVDWRRWPDDLGTFDVVCAADVLYEREYAELVTGAIARALAPGGTAWIADPGRVAFPDFAAAMARAGFAESERLTAVIRSDPDAGDLAASARPGETVTGANEAAAEAAEAGRTLHHRVTITAWKRRSDGAG